VTAPIGSADWQILDALGWDQSNSVFLNGIAASPVLGGVDYALGAPEPASWTTMLAGLALGGAAVRRRRSRSGSAPAAIFDRK
jgi:MYXO-CTERM domain-containing protein